MQEPKTKKEYKFDPNDIRKDDDIIYYEKDKIEIQLQPINLSTVELLFFESDSNIKGLARLKLCQFLNYYNNNSPRKDNIKIIVKAVNYSGKFKSLNDLVKLYEKMSFKFKTVKEPQASGETTIKDFLKFCESYRLGQTKKEEPQKPKFKIDQSKQPKTTPSKIVMSQKPALNTKKIIKKTPVKKPAPKKKEDDKDINYKKVFKVFDEYYKLVNNEFKKYLKGQISSDELDEKQYNELKDEYDYNGLAISLGLYKDIRGNRFIDPDIEKQLKKDSKNYQEFRELIKKPAPIEPIQDDEDIDDWEGEDLTCYLDNYLNYGKPQRDPWSEVKKGLSKEHQSFDKYKNHLLQGYKRLLTTDKDMTLKNCGEKKFNEAMKQYRAIDRAKSYNEYFVNYVDLGFGKTLGIRKPNPYRKRKN